MSGTTIQNLRGVSESRSITGLWKHSFCPVSNEPSKYSPDIVFYKGEYWNQDLQTRYRTRTFLQ